ncbi:MAG: MFS transporter [Pseudomonadota bacterium]
MNPDSANSGIGSSRAWFIWCLSALAFSYAFIQRVTPSVMVDDLMAEFAIGAAVLGTLSALYFYPYVLMQVPLGALIDRLGARLLLTVALSVAGLGSFIFASSDTLFLAYTGRLLIGIGCAVGFLGSLAIAAKWFPPHRFAFFSGLVMLFGMSGGILGQGPLASVLTDVGWRNAMLGLGGFGILLALMVFIFVRNTPEGSSSSNAPQQSWWQVWSGLARAISRLEVWKIAIVASTMSGAMLTLGGLWGTPYLISAYGLDKAYAASLVSLMFLGWAFGAPSIGWLSDRIKRRKILLIIGSAILCVCLAIICFIPDLPLWITVTLFVISGTSGSAMATCFALVRENSPPEISGSVFGIVNSLTVASGAVLQPGVGYILDQIWNGTFENGARVYSTADYQTGFLLILASCMLGFCISLLLKENPATNSTQETAKQRVS